MNPAGTKITGYSFDELFMLDFWVLIHPEHRDAVIENVLTVLGWVTSPTQGEALQA